MAALVSRSNGMVSLAMPSKTDAENGDTSSPPFSSAHIKISRIENEKTDNGACEYKIDFSEYQVHQNIFVVKPEQFNGVDVSGGENERTLYRNAKGAEACSAGDEPLSSPPQCMCEASASATDELYRDGIIDDITFRPPFGQCAEAHPSAKVEDPISDVKDIQEPIRRLSSSSIPHLMSASRAFSAEGQHLIHRQLHLSFLENEATRSPSIRSRDNSFAFPVDGDDSGFGSAHLDTNAKQVASASLESNFSSPTLSLASVNFTLSYPRLQVVPPPCNIPLEVGEGMQQQLHLTVTCNQIRGNSEQENLHASLHREKTRINRFDSKQSAVPVLYSAINSLERYNAGSFDNKVMSAKVRGMHGRQKAFPGVPRKGIDQSSPETIRAEVIGCSAVEQTSSSAVSPSARRRSPIGSTLDEACNVHQLEIGMEQTVAITSTSSGSGFQKSKSSGNLRDGVDEKRSDKMGELKVLQTRMKGNRSVVINDHLSRSRTGRRRDKRVGVFRPSSDAYTPRMENRDIKYKTAEERESVEKISSSMGTIQRPNFRDALRRVAIILHQHIVKIESRFSTGSRGADDTGLFKTSMREQFNEVNFVTPRYKCSMVRVPMARPGVVYSMRKIRVVHTTPTTDEIYEFAHQLFKKVQLSSECSIVCLIYVEKLMEVSKVPLVSETWRPIFMCGLLLASKVWQDLSSWNIEFASVYPQFSLHAINRLELLFLKFIKWDLYISSR